MKTQFSCRQIFQIKKCLAYRVADKLDIIHKGNSSTEHSYSKKAAKKPAKTFGLENSKECSQIFNDDICIPFYFFMYPGQELCTFDPKVNIYVDRFLVHILHARAAALL